MQSTTVTISGKGSNPKTTLYVGGLQESVNEAILHSAFIPFGVAPCAMHVRVSDFGVFSCDISCLVLCFVDQDDSLAGLLCFRFMHHLLRG